MKAPEQYKFIIELGKALHTYGVPSYKSQAYLEEIAQTKGIRGSFMDSPTWINYIFYEDDDQSYNYVECVLPGELNLGGLSRIVEITDDVIADKIDFDEAKRKVKAIKSDPPIYSRVTEMFAFMLVVGSFSITLDTNWVSSIVSVFVGMMVYFTTLLARKSGYVRSTLESLVSFMATLLVGFLSLFIEDIDLSKTILASIIIFIPGLSLTVALEEITSRSLVSGTAKLFDALISLFKQFFGVVLGLATLPLLVEVNPEPVVDDIPLWVNNIAMTMLALSLAFVFKVSKKDLFYCTIAGVLSYFTTTILAPWGVLVSTFIGTLVAVLVSKIIKRIRKSVELVYLVPGIIMLVPGSKAFIGLSSVFLTESGSSGEMGSHILYVFMGIIGGLIFAGNFMDSGIKQAYTQSVK